ncbi:hypothetical protein [uncultured Thiodictyon sp.]|uniref:hypothetical protein n=1 Tax=uncultured Thiodictyon sp. TaxID=1846217 RepID=UPI0025F70B9E|nr:hypothetical protein [uncultured Thiodictyon sp.]
MTGPLEPNDIQALLDYTEEDFADWLQEGYCALTSTDREIAGYAFFPLHNLMASRQSIADFLEQIYCAFPDRLNVKARFRKGLATAFERLAREPNMERQLPEVLHLATLIRADELAHRLVPALSLIPKRGGVNPTYGALTYLNSLAPFAEGPPIVRNIVTLPDTEPRFAVFAWLTMCKCDPDNWPNHLAASRELISAARRLHPGTPEITAARFASFMPLANIAAHLHRLVYCDNNELARQADNWLLNALMGSPSSPYLVIRRETDFALGLRPSTPDQPMPWEHITEGDIRADDPTPFLRRISKDYWPPSSDQRPARSPAIETDLGDIHAAFQRFDSILQPNRVEC